VGATSAGFAGRPLNFLPGAAVEAGVITDSELYAPDFAAPLEVSQYMGRVPPGATIKGMFVTSLLNAVGPKCDRLPEARKSYVAFKDYPLSEQVRLIPEVARVVHPELPLRQAIRAIGHRIYPEFSASLIGKVLFAAVGKDPAALLQAGAKAYAMSASVGTVELHESTNRHALIQLHDMYNYIDCYQIGIIEGAFAVIGLCPAVRIKLDSPVSGWFKLTW
jgi:uncharacterized protein (TIGR02265 family)